MMAAPYSGRTIDYLGSGLIAARPGAPNLFPGTVGLYYCTDVGSEKLTAWDGMGWADVGGGGSGDVVGPASAVDQRIAVFDGTTGKLIEDGGQTIAQVIAAGGGATAYTIVTEASAFTADPGVNDGLYRYNRCGGDVTFDSAEPYTAGMVFNIRATGALDLIESGVTLIPPAGGTLGLDADMAVQVVFTSSTAADVIGQTVPL